MKNRVCALVLAAAMVLGFSTPAFAHDPIFLADDQTTPDTGPFMPDGSISWALYGTVLDAGDTRGFEFDLRDGDEVFVSLLIPNLSPEVDLADDELPIIELEGPDGAMVTISPEVREVFDEPFSNTSYVTLAEYRMPAQPGRYRGVVIGGAPARFSVAIGETEIFFTETERSGDRPSNFTEITEPLTAWYTTLPGGEPGSADLAEGEAEIDLELIEEAMASGEAEAPEGSADEAADTDDPAAMAEEESMAEEEAMEDDEAIAEEETMAEEGEAIEVTESTEPDLAEPAGDPDTSETASVPIDDSAGSSATWVAPVGIGVIALLGGGVFLSQRRGGE